VPRIGCEGIERGLAVRLTLEHLRQGRSPPETGEVAFFDP